MPGVFSIEALEVNYSFFLLPVFFLKSFYIKLTKEIYLVVKP